MKKASENRDKILFCRLFNFVMNFFELKAKSLCNATDSVAFSESSVSSWRTRNPPRADIDYDALLKAVKTCLFDKKVNEYYNNVHKKKYVDELSSIITEYCSIPDFVRNWADCAMDELAIKTIEFAHAFARFMPNKTNQIQQVQQVQEVAATTVESRTNAKTKAVVFDYDGTLTMTNETRTTWESIWTILGYSVGDCVNLHSKFSNGEIDHARWCLLTEEKFKVRNLHRDQLMPLIEGTRLIHDIDKVFRELDRRGIQIYIVSGSIKYIIRKSLGALVEYVSGGIDANTFDFDEEGYLSHIIGTAYDFDGKAARITAIAKELKIKPNQILFVGNSLNDEWAHLSGARTLLINPKQATLYDKTIWNDLIKECNSLLEILKYV